MKKPIFTVFADLTTMEEVAKFEALLMEMEVDEISRPYHWARRPPYPGNGDPLASVFVYAQNGVSITSGYRSVGSDQAYKVTPDQLYAVLKIIQHLY